MRLRRSLVRFALASTFFLAACSESTTPAPVVSALGSAALLPIGVGNALTLPAQRHLVRIGGTMLFALQQDGADGHMLGMYRSDDNGGSFQYVGPIQDTSVDRDTADMVVVGQDIALVYSYEGPELVGSTAHDVYFQWWRHRSNGTWSPDPAVKIFDSTSSSNGFYRAELALDSLGRYWVQAFYLESDGSATAYVAVSSDGGAHFAAQPTIAHLAFRGGGRILSVGSRMIFIYDGHDDGTHVAHFRTRDDSQALGTWNAEQTFPDGVYHGAALSAVADGHGGMHFVYKDKNAVLWYRAFDGTRFGAAQLVENVGNWELQPAITRIGDDVAIFYNRVITTNTNDEVRVRTLHAGQLGAPLVLDSTGGFKGYPAAIDVLPTSVTSVPCFFGDTPDADSGGQATLYTIGWSATSPPPDLATRPPVDMATPETDLATGGGETPSLLFSDDFNRNIAPYGGLGANWFVASGAWFVHSFGQADYDGGNIASETAATCRDCRVEADVTTFGVKEAGVFLRAPSTAGASRYELMMLANGHVQVRRVVGGTSTTLGDVAGGAAALNNPATLSLQATGTGPVTLVAAVNGVTKLTITDASSALAATGYAGLRSSSAGVWFDNLSLWAIGGGGGGGGSGGGGGGGGAVDMARPVDLAMPPPPRDMATPLDLATPPPPRDMATAPDLATSPDLATGGGGTPGVLFSDDFTRSIPPYDGLGTGWFVASGAWFVHGTFGQADYDGGNLASATTATCRDCSVTASVTTFGVPEAGVFSRAPSTAGASRYELMMLGNGHVQVRRVVNGASTTLGDAAGGAAPLNNPVTLSLQATGAGPVTLVAAVNGVTKLTLTDASTALAAAGYAGLRSSSAGVWFDDFSLVGSAGAPNGGGGSGGGGGGGAGGGGGGGGGAGGGGGGSSGPFALTVTYTNTSYTIQAVDPAGTAYATSLSDGGNRVYASTDGRSFTLRGSHSAGGIYLMTALSDGTLLAYSRESSGNAIARSTDHGATWTDVLPLGVYRALTPHSWAELDGTVYFVEYQTFTQDATPIRLWASTNHGATWTTRYTFQGHRHGHGLAADPSTHTLWVYFGDTDPQCGVYRSSDGGATWQFMLGQQDGDVVDATPLPGGGLLFGQDISYLPTRPSIAKLDASGKYTILAPIIGPAYSIHALAQGGYVVGAARENGGDIYPPGEVSAHLYGSADGVTWKDLLDFPWADPNGDYVRADVYWELPATHELVLTLYNAAGFGPGGQGYQLLKRQ